MLLQQTMNCVVQRSQVFRTCARRYHYTSHLGALTTTIFDHTFSSLSLQEEPYRQHCHQQQHLLRSNFRFTPDNSIIKDYQRLLYNNVNKNVGQCCRYLSTTAPAMTVATDDSPTLSNSIPKPSKIIILYASQGGTAQLYAQELANMITNLTADLDVLVQACDAQAPGELFMNKSTWYIFLTSTSGIGEPPNNGLALFDYLCKLQSQTNQKADTNALENLPFIHFGLGNSKAHPHHFNAFARNLYDQLVQLHAVPIIPLTLGDDGDCLDDDFDQWSQNVLSLIEQSMSSDDCNSSINNDIVQTLATLNDNHKETALKTVSVESFFDEILVPTINCPGAKNNGQRRAPPLEITPLRLVKKLADKPENVRLHLLNGSSSNSFYQEGTRLWRVCSQTNLNSDASSNGLRELVIEPDSSSDLLDYQTGDHLLVYPRNPEYLVQAFLDQVLDDVDPYAIICDSNRDESKYLHPTGLNIYETLSHCVDLQAIPSPSTARYFLSKTNNTSNTQIDYKHDVAQPQRRMLDILLESSGCQKCWSLEDVLYHLPPLQPRYYSIASSNLAHPDKVYLTFRPVRYTSKHGHIQLGLCTNYMSQLSSSSGSSTVVAKTQSNPLFRLPSDPVNTPVVFLAGGCGVAPIRAFIEERMHLVKENVHGQPLADAFLYLGFRNPADQVYQEMFDKAIQIGALTEAHVTFNTGGDSEHQGLISDLIHRHGSQLYQHWQNGGYTYLCGGARTFGVAMERMVQTIVQEQAKCSEEDAAEYLRELISKGRFLEDLSD